MNRKLTIGAEALDTILINAGVSEEEERTVDVAVLTRLQPRTKRIIVTKPDVSAYHHSREVVSSRLGSPIVVPGLAMHNLREFGMKATVLKIAPDIHEDIAPGVTVVIPEHAGKPIYLAYTTPYWIIGEGDVLLVLEDEDES